MAEVTYLAVKNHEEQYSLWPSHKELPPGWTSVHGPASKEACLDYVRENWTDMRPLSVRQPA